jgi:putative membrane protein insertion efficiency factor
MNPITVLIAGLIRGYQLFVSPFFPPSCRFEPTCSHYALGAVKQHGPLVGVGLAIWRIVRCNPFFAGGVDPVPDAPLWRARRARERPSH